MEGRGWPESCLPSTPTPRLSSPIASAASHTDVVRDLCLLGLWSRQINPRCGHGLPRFHQHRARCPLQSTRASAPLGLTSAVPHLRCFEVGFLCCSVGQIFRSSESDGFKSLMDRTRSTTRGMGK